MRKRRWRPRKKYRPENRLSTKGKRQNKTRVYENKDPKNPFYNSIVPFTKEGDRNYIEKLIQVLGLFQDIKKWTDEKINLEQEKLIEKELILKIFIEITLKKSKRIMQGSTIFERK